MYGWLWRHLPGGFAVKLLLSLALAIAAVAVLWFLVFPNADTWLPWGDVTVNEPQSPDIGP